MKKIRSINISDKVWDNIPVQNKSRFVEFALMQAIDGFKGDK